jgi:hypothetical protein
VKRRRRKEGRKEGRKNGNHLRAARIHKFELAAAALQTAENGGVNNEIFNEMQDADPRIEPEIILIVTVTHVILRELLAPR